MTVTDDYDRLGANQTFRRAIATGLCCVALLTLLAALSWQAVSTKSATTDEPLHLVGAYVRLFERDFRVNAEDPPLFGYWAMLGQLGQELHLDRALPEWTGMLGNMELQFDWVARVFYFTPANDPDRLLARCRAWMVLLGVLLGAVMALWAWRLAGSVAAIVALLLLCLDPNFLGHSPLLKNDVPVTLMIVSTALAAWSVGRRVTWWNVVGLALVVAVAGNVKFSGLIALPIAVLCLVIRCFQRADWPMGATVLRGLAERLAAVMGIAVCCAIAWWVVTWAAYQFRYRPTPNPQENLNLALLARQAGQASWFADNQAAAPIPRSAIDKYEASPLIQAVLLADRYRLMPQAWSAGMLNTYAQTRRRSAYLLGQVRATGWWYYFPVAMLAKTPISTLAALSASLALLPVLRRRRNANPLHHWDRACLLTPVAIYGLAALSSNLNIGLRHVLPIYPFMFVFVGVVAARCVATWRRPAMGLLVVLAGSLATETALAHPNYLAFFNALVGGPRGGIRVLGDSNLDWGQDLLLLRDWQQRHPDIKLYAALFGSADPGRYIRYTPLPGNEYVPVHPQPIDGPGVAAISASVLQGFTLDPELRAAYTRLREQGQPIEVLGGTIYLYDAASELLPRWQAPHE